MSIFDTMKNALKITYETREKIRQAIIDKGVDVPSGTSFDEYSNKIADIEIKNDEYYKNLINAFTENGTNFGSFFENSKPTGELKLYIDTSKATSLWSMFYSCDELTQLDLSNLDTSNVTDMSSMFSFCRNLTSLDLSSFNTSNVTDMGFMFGYCTNLTSLDLSSFNTSNVINMNGMFEYCVSLTELDLSNFDTRNVTNMYIILSDCTELKRLKLNNCNKETVEMIINSSGLPRHDDEVKRYIYCKKSSCEGLTCPQGWTFIYVD